MRLLLLFLALFCGCLLAKATPKPYQKPLNKLPSKTSMTPATTTVSTTTTTIATTTEIPTTVEEITETTTAEEQTTTIETETEATTQFECPCKDKETPETSFNEDPQQIPQCSCDQTQECQDELTTNLTQVDTCFEQCHQRLEDLGNSTENYIDCFQGDKIGGFASAEICLQNRLKDYCIKGNETKMIDQPSYERYLDFEYKDESKESYWPIQKKASKTFQSFQKFYHCTKHCVHKKLIQCLEKKRCAVQLPPHESFIQSMQECAKSHNLVHLNLWNSCRCLLMEKKVNLHGQCAVLITPAYTDSL